MKKTLFIMITAFLFSGMLHAKPKFNSLPHLDLDMSGAEYEGLYENQRGFAGPLDDILGIGKRNLDWLKFINDHRAGRPSLSFSSAETQVGTPMDKPKTYNPDIIRKNYGEMVATLPEAFKAVLFENQPFTPDPPMSDKEYLDLGRAVDTSYQIAARWMTMQPYLLELEARKSQDIRGYYFLSQTPGIKEKLSQWNSLDAATQKLYSSYLTEMCWNNEETDCENVVSKATKANQAYGLYSQYLTVSKQVYDDFFRLLAQRPDVSWVNGAKEEMHVPFTDPNNQALKSFLADNIQDEWRLNSWKLLLDFGPPSPTKAELAFEPGATPHVNELAGNTIVMDANSPLTEYNVQWAIRHEFGHVLGFPDCYVEFYDSATNIITSYQLDITNLMCSRRGHIKDVHYNELKKAYDKVGVILN